MDKQDAAMNRRRGFVAGVVAGVPMVAAMLVLSRVAGMPTLPDLFADPVLFLIPGAVFGALIDALQFTAKSLLVAGLLVGQLVVCGLVGRIWAGQVAKQAAPKPWLTLAVVVGAVYVALGGFLLPLLGQGVFPYWGGYAALHVVYALALVAAYEWDATFDAGRREMLVSGVAVVAGGTLWRAMTGATVAGTPSGSGELSEEVTPNDRFYTVSKNLVSDPKVDAGTWRLRIDGLVEMPTTFTLDAIRSMPSVEVPFTLACISNLVGGDLVGNAKWKGVRLRDVLNAAGVKAGARKVVFMAADGYTDSLPPAKAMEDGTLLVYEMNGEPLTYKHGAPARLLIPGIYGMKNCKWITQIQLLDHDFKGYWQQQGWNDQATIQTMSRFDVPLNGKTVSAPLKIGGIAHAGDRGIKKVEVSTDGGKTWAEAERRPPLSLNSWTIWTMDWNPAKGSYKLQVRATDGLDRTQVPQYVDSFPDGSTGYHSISVRVA
jgi:DMSO/TMAO reductase YedYZ molybdopterin-dependent catalytic subunit